LLHITQDELDEDQQVIEMAKSPTPNNHHVDDHEEIPEEIPLPTNPVVPLQEQDLQNDASQDQPLNTSWLDGTSASSEDEQASIDMGNDDDTSLFSFSSDVSEYTLDHRGNISSAQKAELKKRNTLKKTLRFQNLEVPSTKEKILVGDVLCYVPPMFVQGHPKSNFHRRDATVISVDPDAENGHKIEFDNLDHLEDEHCVIRIKTLQNGKLVSHPGTLRSIEHFVLEKQTSCAGQSMNLTVKKTNNIIKKNILKSRKKIPTELKRLFDGVVEPFENRRSKRNRTKK